MMKERLETVRILIENGANVNFVTKNLKMTPLHWAAHQGDVELVKLLLRHKAI
jgi:ankyrin repeat protein